VNRAQLTAVLGADYGPAELAQLVGAQRDGAPFMYLRDGTGCLAVVALAGDRLVVGRAPGNDVELAWDPRVSGVHAYLERRGRGWVLEDDGLSRNGTFVGAERLRGQHVLRDGETVRLGETVIGYCDPQPETVAATIAVATSSAPAVTEAQLRVLHALCRPLIDGGRATATNEQIAQELVLSLAAVKSHLRVLFDRFALHDVPQSQKRLVLAQRALAEGVVATRPGG
jgi:hypothetical protein